MIIVLMKLLYGLWMMSTQLWDWNYLLIAKKAIFPPEFIRVKVPKNKKIDYMYCKLINTLS